MSSSKLSEDVLAPIRATFFQECEELLAELETGLLALQDGARDTEVVDAVFRAAHSIKGGAGAFGLAGLVRIAHAFESALDAVRVGQAALTADLLKLLLSGSDALADTVQRARAQPDSASLAPEVEALAAALSAVTPAVEHAVVVDDEGFLDFDFTPRPVSLGDEATRSWRIDLRPHTKLYARACEPLLLLRDLADLGDVSVTLDLEQLPPLEQLEPEDAYLGWSVRLTTALDEASIREVFAFVEDDCDLCITLLEAPETAEAAPVTDAGARTLSDAPREAIPTIRVDLDRIDRLVNLVGELAINQAMLAQRLADAGIDTSSDFQAPLDDLDHLTRDLQDSVMAIRAQPVKTVFQRLARVVREAEAATGKQVRLVISGEDTEVDRTVIERLTDPLTHMVRNAVDHGLETPAERLACGKPAAGTIRISAEHRGGRIVIGVADDGRGLDRDAVFRAATRRGLVATDANLSHDEIDNLIFAAGFSTTTEISALSGRGVGMDVVKRGVQELGGRIAVDLRPGQGATFTLSLPLTLAVLDGMVISIAGHSLVAPLTSLIESVRPTADSVRRLGPSARLLRFRGEYVPLIDLGIALGYRSQPAEPTQGIALVIQDDLGGYAGLLVDEILGQRQVVIKSLDTNYRPVRGVAAATILGDGRVALILDVGAIAATHRAAPEPALRIARG